MPSLPTIGIEINNIFILYLGNLWNTFQFLIETALHIISFFLLCTKNKKMGILLFRCQPPSFWPPALPVNLTYILIVFFYIVTSEPAPYKLITFQVPNLTSIFRRLGRFSKQSIQVRGSCELFITYLFLGEGLLAQAGRPALVVCLQLHIQGICSYPPITGGRPSIRNPKTRNSVEIRDPPNMEFPEESIQSTVHTMSITTRKQ
jgi:hypothetical protein